MDKKLARLDPEHPQRLYGTPILEISGSPPARLQKTAIALGLVAWAATAGLAFMVGRASVTNVLEQPNDVTPKEAQSPNTVSTTAATKAPAQVTETAKAETYPRFASTIPKEFRGAWDEIVTDKCAGREARYYLNATTFNNFEVVTNVQRVKLVSPSEIEISVTGYDDEKNQFNDTIGLRLLDGGKTLTGVEPGSNFYRRCPVS